MKKLSLKALLILLIIPLFSLSMEEDNQPSENIEQTDETIHLLEFPYEMKSYLLYFVVNLDEIEGFKEVLQKISGEESELETKEFEKFDVYLDFKISSTNKFFITLEKLDKIFKEFFKKLIPLRLVSKNMQQMILENKELFHGLKPIIKYCIEDDSHSLVYLKEVLRNAVASGYINLLLIALDYGLTLEKINDFDPDLRADLTGEFLNFSSRCHRNEVCEKLISKGILENVDNADLAKAIYLHDYDTVKNLTENQQVTVLPNGYNGLVIAIEIGDLKIIELLVEKLGIAPLGYFEDTPLMLSAKWGDLDTMGLLLLKGVNINQSNKMEHTALNWAAKHGRLNAVKFLVEKGAIFNTPKKDGTTIIMDAAYNGDVNVVKFFEQNGIDPLAVAKDNKTTALTIAKKYGHNKLVKYLKDLNANHEPVEEKSGNDLVAKQPGNSNCILS